MSQPPPPYGEPAPGQHPQQQPYPSYGAGAYPNPYGQVPPQRPRTTRNVLIVVGVVIVAFCAGLVGLGVLAVNKVDDGFDSAFNEDYRGSQNDPLTLEEGESFEIRGYSYAEGWTLTPNSDYDDQITGLKATNNDADTESYNRISLVFTFYSGDEALGQVDCRSAVSLRRGKSTTLDCSSSETVPSGYDTLEVYDSALYE